MLDQTTINQNPDNMDIDSDFLEKFSSFQFSKTVTKSRTYFEFSLKSHKLDIDEIQYALEIVEQFKNSLEEFLNSSD